MKSASNRSPLPDPSQPRADPWPYVEAIASLLCRVPDRTLDGVCRTCASSASQGHEQCYPCSVAEQEIGRLPSVVPISMSVDRDGLHHRLRGYKDSEKEGVRRRQSTELAALLAVFWREHAACMPDYDTICVMPSVGRSESPIGSLAGRVADLRPLIGPGLTAAAGASRSVTESAFVADPSLAGKRVMLLDDTFASGGTAFSAVRALRAVDAEVTNILVIGRHVRPVWEPSQRMLKWLTEAPWNREHCVECTPARPSGTLF